LDLKNQGLARRPDHSYDTLCYDARVSSPLFKPRLASIHVHPIKSLDPVSVETAVIGPSGGLVHDRDWAIYNAQGGWINGKRNAAVHRLRTRYDLTRACATFAPADSGAGSPPATFRLHSEARAAAEWLGRYFGEPVELRHSPQGFPDDDNAPGPTIVSTASLEAVCGWFPHLTLASVRERFRANLEIAGVPAFWEDQLFAADADALVRFRIGEVLFEGTNPCARCVVPSRDPLTGDVFNTFQVQFTEARRAHLPPWAPAARFDHFYRLCVNTRIQATEAGKILRVGDPLALL